MGSEDFGYRESCSWVEIKFRQIGVCFAFTFELLGDKFLTFKVKFPYYENGS